jgi:pimeloyl-ACP methyl ester carboxylesterase
MTNRKREAIECALAQAWESYSGVRARWHWKMALEQTTFSHRSFAHELRGKNVELLAGDLDDEVPVRLTSATRELASRIRAPFELVRGAGHSLHAEVPKWLATRLER